jgi:hypothetical protein
MLKWRKMNSETADLVSSYKNVKSRKLNRPFNVLGKKNYFLKGGSECKP